MEGLSAILERLDRIEAKLPDDEKVVGVRSVQLFCPLCWSPQATLTGDLINSTALTTALRALLRHMGEHNAPRSPRTFSGRWDQHLQIVWEVEPER